MNLAVLFSGGKDSTLALYKASKYHKISCLVSIISENKESYMFHTPNIHLIDLQAKAIGLPLLKVKTKGEKEKELEDLKKILKTAKSKYKIQGIVTGAIRSVYQASRIQKICDELGLWCFNPLWLNDQIELLNEIVKNDLKVIISGIFAFPLEKELLGKELNFEIINKLKGFQEKFQLNPAGEGGEIETTVIDAPFFKNKIEIVKSSTSYANHSGTFEIKEAKLSKK